MDQHLQNFILCNSATQPFSQSLIIYLFFLLCHSAFSCLKCEKAFRDSGDLKKEERIHTDEKPSKSSNWDIAFRQKGALKKHGRIQTDGKPFSCSICDMTFRNSGDLKNQERIQNSINYNIWRPMKGSAALMRNHSAPRSVTRNSINYTIWRSM